MGLDGASMGSVCNSLEPTAPDLLDSRLRQRIGALSDEIERERRLPTELVGELAARGLFRLCVPRVFGGLEVDAATLLRTIEAVAQSDGSAGWCVMIGSTTGLVSAYLEESIARAIYGSADVVTGGVFAPTGSAKLDGDSFHIRGRWAFASGCQHCDWLMGGCVILDDGRPRLLPNGMPDARMVLFPAKDARIHDTWDVAGLRGTGSHDIEIDGLAVPVSHSVSLMTDKPRHPGPLYRFPVFGLLALGIAAVATGIARRAIDELVGLAAAKTPTGSRRRLAERGAVQASVAEAEAILEAARALLFQSVDEASRSAAGGNTLSLNERARLRLAATHATASAARAVDLMYNLGGGTSIYSRSPLQRCFRDSHVATQHLMVATPTYELIGRVLLGLDSDSAQV